MSYASHVLSSPQIRLPHVAMPKFRWPRVSPGARALLMMGLMVSPAFLSDYIGFGVMRLFHSDRQIAEMRPPDVSMLSRVNIFHVACADSTTPTTQRQWNEFAARNGWPMYPQGGATCFRPDRVLLGVAGLKTFNVACPTAVLTVADRRQWLHFAADHGWGPYPQAGTDCVDP